jgi:hypothetical protein
MRFWTTDWSYNDFFNRLRVSAKFALMEFSEVRLQQVSYSRLYEP